MKTRQRTILLGDCRTGSHLLARSLNQHPDLQVSDEVFSKHGGNQVPAFSSGTFDDLFSRFDIVMVQRYQADENPSLLGRVCDRMISLTRHTFAQFKSYKTAIATNHWRCDHPLPENPESIVIPFKWREYQQFADRTTQRRRKMRYRLPTLNLTYGSLSNYFGGTMEKVLKFLQVPYKRLGPAISRTPKFPVQYVDWPVFAPVSIPT